MRFMFHRGAIAAAAALFVLCLGSCNDPIIPCCNPPKDSGRWIRYPQGADFYGVFGFASNDIFAVADEGDIYRYDGETWRYMPSGTTADLLAVWGSSPGDVWAVGTQGTILRFQRGLWTAVGSGTAETLNGVWGSGEDDVFFVGAQGTILHYDGSGISPMGSASHTWLTGVWGSAPNDVFAVGWGNTILHYDGSAWSSMVFEGPDLFAVWGRSANDVWAVGGSRVYRYNGSVWALAFEDAPCCWKAIWGGADPASTVFVAGDNGMLARYDGGHWWWDTDPGRQLRGIWGSASTDAVVVGSEGTILHWNGSAWTPEIEGISTCIRDISGTSVGSIFAVGDGRDNIWRFDGSIWQGVASAPADHLWGVCAISVADAFAVGSDGCIMHYDAGEWEIQQSGFDMNLFDVWGRVATDVYAVGQYGRILHYDGSSWSTVRLGGPGGNFNLYGVWGSLEGDIFAVGGNGTIFRGSGSDWTLMESGTVASLMAVWGSASDDVYAVGEGGTILHFDGRAWSVMQSEAISVLEDVAGAETGLPVIAVGTLGQIFRFDGTSWRPMAGGARDDLLGVWKCPMDGFFAVGCDGSILRLARP